MDVVDLIRKLKASNLQKRMESTPRDSLHVYVNDSPCPVALPWDGNSEGKGSVARYGERTFK
jgi:hypothetical protein